jgi:60 kDa SS-A/Ro ribonucleoprotein
MQNLAKHISYKQIHQKYPIPGKIQVENNAGGFVYSLDCWKRLNRFLILGSEGGTYYAGERDVTIQNTQVLHECATEDCTRTINTIVEVSESGRAPKNDPAILALAVLASSADPRARYEALNALPRVCRIGTHLFQFIAACKELRGWGRGLRGAVASWYNSKPVDRLTYQVTKYRNRAGYTHRDALRLSHPKADTEDKNRLYKWITTGTLPLLLGEDAVSDDFKYVIGLTRANALDKNDVRNMVRLIDKYDLVFEHVPNHFLSKPEVWEAMLPNLKPTALIRNLGKMTSIGLLSPLSQATKYVCDTLNNPEALKLARVHPLSILLASDTYGQGHGFKGSLTWNPNQQIKAALESAFYAAFDAVEPTNKRHLLAIDVSGSMGLTQSRIAGTNITARQAAAAMSLVTNRIEPQTYTLGFSHELVDLAITSRSDLNSVVQTMKNLPMKRTNCALPMLHAIEHKLNVDAFVVYTDNETWFGDIHPSQALDKYRQASGIDAKLIVVGMTATEFTIADPNDSGMLDVVGMDSSCPAIMADFVRD